ncbi:hypothetical protein OpiT1DRAFT_00009 [Opitutaceae bacterium TAV1]|nr:hypothetical protein OpiT1DRAFT_00009 [Opitutaceae bacterium TAV1]
MARLPIPCRHVLRLDFEAALAGTNSYHKQPRKEDEWLIVDEDEGGYLGYRVAGYLAVESGGGSGQFHSVLVLRKGAARIRYDDHIQERPVLDIAGLIGLGDRSTSKIVINHNTVRVVPEDALFPSVAVSSYSFDFEQAARAHIF